MRVSLAGDMLAALLDFIARARSGGTLYAALYELGDDELIGALESVGRKLHLVLSNPDPGDGQSASALSDGNAASRARLAKTAGLLVDRMLPSGQIGHNKFVVHVDAHGHPAAVLFGSTNWTATGLCAQTNNTIVCDDPRLARRYLDDWKQLAKDTAARRATRRRCKERRCARGTRPRSRSRSATVRRRPAGSRPTRRPSGRRSRTKRRRPTCARSRS